MDLVKLQATKSIYKTPLHFCVVTMNYPKTEMGKPMPFTMT
jgi:hypothetical protein